MSYRGQLDNYIWSQPYTNSGRPVNSSHLPHNGEFSRQRKWTQSPYVQPARSTDNCRERHNPYTYRNSNSRDSCISDRNWCFSNNKSRRERPHPYVASYYHTNYSYLASGNEFRSNRMSQVGLPSVNQRTISNRNGLVPFANEARVDHLSNISYHRADSSLPKDSSMPVPGTLRNHSPLTPNAQSFRPSVSIRNSCNFPKSSLNISDKPQNVSEMTKFVQNCQEPTSYSSFPVHFQSKSTVEGLNGAPTEEPYLQNNHVLATNHYNKTTPTVSNLNESNALYIPVKLLVVTNSLMQNGLSLSMAASQGNPPLPTNAPGICLQDESRRDNVYGTSSERRSGQVSSNKTVNAIARPVQNWKSNDYNDWTHNSLYSSAPPSQELHSSCQYPTLYLEDGSQNLSKSSRPTTDQGIWRTSTSQFNRQINNGRFSQPHHNGTEMSKKADYLTKSISPNLVQRSNTKVEQPKKVKGSCSAFAGRNTADKIDLNPCLPSYRYNSECDPDNFITKTDYFYQEEVQSSTE
ncbi:uncharacterized protein LOC135224446 [Macrobrachium nipponense]|uniref:uncharacterized protein LOC135224446 n=1 Tax=Macrobrachium nipponense TaxID=159736 RepID=UPI0030C7BFD7